ncbi:MAG: methyltransferase domain-containing protein [Leptospiraceae bacterium]|nr:methyltransferase domain-containing protein [Leptospiraceae bacterium]
MRRFFQQLKEGTEHLNYGRHIIADWGAELYANSIARPFRILDLGCGPGTDLDNIRIKAAEGAGSESRLQLEMHGLESWPPNIEKCNALGIQTWQADLERDRYPGADQSFDLIVANQVLEHTKEIFWIFNEADRLLKPGGHFMIGVPNLASFHNRILLMFGQQPTQIQSMSAHVRGFTKPDLRRFGETGDFFRLVAFRGSNFYPLPPFLSKPLARLLPTMAWGAFLLFERTTKQGEFLECLHGDEHFLETPFYGSPQNPAPKPRAGRTQKQGRQKTAATQNSGPGRKKKSKLLKGRR